MYDFAEMLQAFFYQQHKPTPLKLFHQYSLFTRKKMQIQMLRFQMYWVYF